MMNRKTRKTRKTTRRLIKGRGPRVRRARKNPDELELYAQPYDVTKTGFYFNDLDDYEKKSKRSGAEEFEIQFIEGSDQEEALFKVMDVNQANLVQYFEVLDELQEYEITALMILMGGMGYDFDAAMGKKDDLIVYGEFDDDKEFAQEYVDGIGGLKEALGDNVENYFDWDSFARDLMFDMSEYEGIYYDPNSV